MTVTIIFAVLLALALFLLAAILDALKKLGEKVDNVKMEAPKVEIPKFEMPPYPEFPKIEIPAPQVTVQNEPPVPQEIKLDYSEIVEAIKNIKIEIPKIEAPAPKIEIPKIEMPPYPEFPKIEIPAPQVTVHNEPSIPQEIKLDYSEIVEAIKNIKIEIPAPQVVVQNEPQEKDAQAQINAEILQELVTIMRVNQAEFQSGLEAFHKAIDKLLVKIPSGEKEEESKRELLQKFEDAIIAVQEKANETIEENSLRMQEILTEILHSSSHSRESV